MKKLLIALTFGLSLTAQAQITLTKSDTLTAQGLNDAVTSPTLGSGVLGNLSLSRAGAVTYTYLGSEAGFFNGFTAGGNTFLNPIAQYFNATPSTVGNSFTVNQSAGTLDFSFITKNVPWAGTDKTLYYQNGTNFTSADAGSFGIFKNVTMGGVKYEYVLGFNDYYPGVPDFNDMMDGIQLDVQAAVPEPETYAMMLIGFLLVGYTARQKSNSSHISVS